MAIEGVNILNPCHISLGNDIDAVDAIEDGVANIYLTTIAIYRKLSLA
jgi:hypothetical protein